MRPDFEVKLTHDGKEWIAADGDFEVRGRTLKELDQNIKKALESRGGFCEGTQVKILMKFAHETLPDYQRVRQYMPAYFNRWLVIKM
ncbi:hypothetical protein MHLNE_01420 [Moorella humiferrea]|uniref:DUF5395 family protein n=1 Tax=Neomoorella humiferrea TaxID=676965 RepID=UPI0030D49476